MLSLTIFSILLIFAFRTAKKNPRSRTWQILTLASFNVLALEIIAFGYLIYLVIHSQSLFLIGHQKFLDFLIKDEVISSIYLDPSSHQGFYQVDRDTGYSLGKNKQFYVYRSNGQGLRADKNYSLLPSPNILRIAAFGDSFVFCDGEQEKFTWPYMLEKTANNLEVLNFGVSGYGLGLSYLRYINDGLKFHPDVLIINYSNATGRDLFDGDLIRDTNLKKSTMYNVFFYFDGDKLLTETLSPGRLFDKDFRERRIYGPLRLKPSEAILNPNLLSVSNTAVVIKNALLQMKLNKLLLKERDPVKELRYTAQIIKNLLDVAKNNGTNVIFVDTQDFSKLPKEIQLLISSYGEMAMHINITDGIEELRSRMDFPSKGLYNSSSHYNRFGNTLYANAIAFVLKQRSWKCRGRELRFDPASNSFIEKNKH